MRVLSKVAARVSMSMAFVCTVAVISMVVATLLDVSWRIFIGKSLAGVFEFVGLCMVATVFLSFAYTQLHKGHLKVTLMTKYFSRKTRTIIAAVTTAVVIVFISVMLWQGIIGFWESFLLKEHRFGLILFPTWPMKLFIPLGLTGLALQLLAEAVTFRREPNEG